MPLKWKRGTNPYVDNAFGVLQVGPLTSASRIEALVGNRAKAAPRAAGEAAAEVGAEAFAIAEAKKCLNTPARRVEEQLLVHPQAQADDDKRQRLSREIRKLSRLADAGDALPLRSPLAIFWFTPLPGAAAVELPPWEALGLVAAGDAEDLALDIVFDH